MKERRRRDGKEEERNKDVEIEEPSRRTGMVQLESSPSWVNSSEQIRRDEYPAIIGRKQAIILLGKRSQ